MPKTWILTAREDYARQCKVRKVGSVYGILRLAVADVGIGQLLEEL